MSAAPASLILLERKGVKCLYTNDSQKQFVNEQGTFNSLTNPMTKPLRHEWRRRKPGKTHTTQCGPLAMQSCAAQANTFSTSAAMVPFRL